MRRDLRERLERLERRMPPPPDPPSPEEREEAHEISELHFGAWLEGGTLEDVPEQQRDAELWAEVEKYGPIILWVEQGCPLEGGGELPGADADLNPSDDYPDDGDASGELP